MRVHTGADGGDTEVGDDVHCFCVLWVRVLWDSLYLESDLLLFVLFDGKGWGLYRVTIVGRIYTF